MKIIYWVAVLVLATIQNTTAADLITGSTLIPAYDSLAPTVPDVPPVPSNVPAPPKPAAAPVPPKPAMLGDSTKPIKNEVKIEVTKEKGGPEVVKIWENGKQLDPKSDAYKKLYKEHEAVKKGKLNEKEVVIEEKSAEGAKLQKKIIKRQKKKERVEEEVMLEDLAGVEAGKHQTFLNQLRQNLVTDGILKSTSEPFKLKLSNADFEINGKVQPKEVRQKYLKLFEEQHGERLKGKQEIKIEIE